MPRGKANAAVRLTSHKEPVTKLIRQTRQSTRRRYSPDEKIRIVMEGIRGDEPVSALCRREGISANIYYKWLKDFMEAGKNRLKGDETRHATRGEVQEFKRENERLKQLVAELALDNMVLKKSLL
jgi:transposase